MTKKHTFRIGIAGLSCECSTFSNLLSSKSDFRIIREQALLDRYPFILQSTDVTPVPLVFAGAMPGGPIDPIFYTEFKNELLDYLRKNKPLDGLFLHMHGAAFTPVIHDLEGDLLEAVRTITGPDCLISASYDLHGNISRRVINNLNILTAYRFAPHIDWRETLERAFRLLLGNLRNNTKPHLKWIPVPLLLPGEKTSTDFEPAASLYAGIPDIISQYSLQDASILIGYAWADEPRSGASIVAIGTQPHQTTHAARTLAQNLWSLRHDFQFGVFSGSIDDCIQKAVQADSFPVVISDSGDNPTAGGAGDNAFVLKKLLEHGVRDALVGGIVDSNAVAHCFAAGVGQQVNLNIGGSLDPVLSSTLSVTGTVSELMAAENTGAGVIDRPDTAVLIVHGVHVIVTARRATFHQLKNFTELNLNPKEFKILVVKLGYLVPEIKALAGTSLLALTPGAVNQDLFSLPFRHLNHSVFPLDSDTELLF